MAMIGQNGKMSPILIHALLISEILNCVHSYSKLKLIANKAFVSYLKMFLLKAKSTRDKKKNTSFLLKNNQSRKIVNQVQYLNDTRKS